MPDANALASEPRASLATNFDGKIRNGPFNPFAQLLNMLGGYVRDNGDEFVAGIASQEVVLAQLAVNQAGYFA